MLHLALVPSCDTFESHFGQIGVTPQQLADGAYRGTWTTRYALDLQRHGVRTHLVVPSRVVGSWSGAAMNVELVQAPRSFLAMPRRLWRWRLRRVSSYWSSRGLAESLDRYPVVYLQEYAFGRAAALVDQGVGARMIAATHGTNLARAPRFVRRRLPEIAAFTALTKAETRRLEAFLGPAGRSRIEFVPNWVEPEWFKVDLTDRPARLAGQPPTLLWLGRVEYRKDKDMRTLLEGFRELRARMPARLQIVGGGPDFAAIRSKVHADVRIRDDVEFLGRVDDQRALIELVASADAVVNSSRSEGFPLAVLEAAACGRPLVLTDLPYVSEIADMPHLRTFPAEDADGFADAVQSSLAADWDPDAQRNWAHARFSGERSLAVLADLISSVSDPVRSEPGAWTP